MISPEFHTDRLNVFDGFQFSVTILHLDVSQYRSKRIVDVGLLQRSQHKESLFLLGVKFKVTEISVKAQYQCASNA